MKNLNRDVIFTCHFLATTLMWWSFLVSSCVEIELPGDPNVLVSVPFEDCSSQMCWVPKHKPSTFVFLSLFMHYIQILEISQGRDPPKVTYKFPYFMNVSSSALFLLSGLKHVEVTSTANYLTFSFSSLVSGH